MFGLIRCACSWMLPPAEWVFRCLFKEPGGRPTLGQPSERHQQQRSANTLSSLSQRPARIPLPANPQTWRIAFKSQHHLARGSQRLIKCVCVCVFRELLNIRKSSDRQRSALQPRWFRRSEARLPRPTWLGRLLACRTSAAGTFGLITGATKTEKTKHTRSFLFVLRHVPWLHLLPWRHKSRAVQVSCSRCRKSSEITQSQDSCCRKQLLGELLPWPSCWH